MTPELCIALLESIGRQEGLINRTFVRGGCSCAIGSLALIEAGDVGSFKDYTPKSKADEDWQDKALDLFYKLTPGSACASLVSRANEGFNGTPQERRAYMLVWVQTKLDKLLGAMEQDGKLSRWTPPVIESVPTRELVPSRGE